MFLFIERLAEEAIQKHMREGGFENLEGKGRPLPEEDLSMIPEDLRMAYRILKNAGCLPPELERAREIDTALDLLKAMPDERERYRQIRRVNFMIRDLNMRRGRPVAFERAEHYHDRIVERLSTGEKERA
ncbi:MAG: DnaJ family domain-containing protein [Desulfovibrio aminophilus]|uniref:DnaJ family domain-containing protein n=1 Tax=Desulfovibrio aminophilus TaxID=81425 RepID=UPI0039E82626